MDNDDKVVENIKRLIEVLPRSEQQEICKQLTATYIQALEMAHFDQWGELT